jgi:glycosyltransferase involved in cell wall biosynthesis
MDEPTRIPMPALLSIVVPLYNEAAVIVAFHERLGAVLDRVGLSTEIIYVNDGSTDESLSSLLALRQRDQRIAIVDLSRNFGKELALTAGLDHALGDAVVVIDADLQDPPELIPELIAGWNQGYDVVSAQRISREGESWLKRLTAALFYRLLERSMPTPVPRDTGDFRLLSRRALDATNSLRERHRLMKGLFAWIGFPQLSVPYRREARYAGRSKWSYWRLWNLALEGLTSFTIAPLRLASYLGAAVALFAFVYAAVIVYKTLAYGDPVRGYPSLMVTILFLGGVQLLSLGVIGEYLGRIFNETKHRPLYLVNRYLPPEDSAPGASRRME